jgi:hypothetical protein
VEHNDTIVIFIAVSIGITAILYSLIAQSHNGVFVGANALSSIVVEGWEVEHVVLIE